SGPADQLHEQGAEHGGGSHPEDPGGGAALGVLGGIRGGGAGIALLDGERAAGPADRILGAGRGVVHPDRPVTQFGGAVRERGRPVAQFVGAAGRLVDTVAQFGAGRGEMTGELVGAALEPVEVAERGLVHPLHRELVAEPGERLAGADGPGLVALQSPQCVVDRRRHLALDHGDAPDGADHLADPAGDLLRPGSGLAHPGLELIHPGGELLTARAHLLRAVGQLGRALTEPLGAGRGERRVRGGVRQRRAERAPCRGSRLLGLRRRPHDRPERGEHQRQHDERQPDEPSREAGPRAPRGRLADRQYVRGRVGFRVVTGVRGVHAGDANRTSPPFPQVTRHASGLPSEPVDKLSPPARTPRLPARSRPPQEGAMSPLLALASAGLATVVAWPLTRATGRAAGWPLPALYLLGAAALVPAVGSAAAGTPAEVVRLPWVPARDWTLDLRPDATGLLFAVLALVIGAAVLIYSTAYLDRDDAASGKRAQHYGFFQLMTLFTVSMLGLVLTDSLLLLFVCWELTSLASFALIANSGRPAYPAALRTLLLTFVGGLVLLAAVV